MKQRKYGFFVIEWMVQFMLLTTVALISYNLIASWHRTVIKMNSLCNELLPVYIATDIMRADIHEATRVDADKDDALLSITCAYRFIKWYCKDNRLLRSISSYDQKEQRWLKSSYGLMAQHITASKRRLLSSSKGIGHLEVHLKTEHRSCCGIQLEALLRNGLIL
jgi:hypothetical protein